MTAIVTAFGNVGRDPEFRTSQAGQRIGNFSLAVNRKRGEETMATWFSVVCFQDGLNRVIEQYVRKGSRLFVSGEVALRPWTDKEGNERQTLELYLNQMTLAGERKGDQAEEPKGGGIDDARRRLMEDLSDDIPF